jgi:hypothetical protein
VLVVGRRVKLAAAAVGAAVGAAMVLAGCGVHPGTAAVVGSQPIPHAEVDDVANAVCRANVAGAEASGQQASPLPSRGARQLAVEILIETTLAQLLGEREGVEANQRAVSQAVAQNEAGLALLEGKQREDLRTALRDYAESQFLLIEIGRRSLGGQVREDEAIAEGRRILGEYAESVDVEVDPRYGRFDDGVFKPGGTSLSVAQSDRAKEGANQQPGGAFLGTLPASQLCS